MQLSSTGTKRTQTSKCSTQRPKDTWTKSRKWMMTTSPKISNHSNSWIKMSSINLQLNQTNQIKLSSNPKAIQRSQQIYLITVKASQSEGTTRSLTRRGKTSTGLAFSLLVHSWRNCWELRAVISTHPWLKALCKHWNRITWNTQTTSLSSNNRSWKRSALSSIMIQSRELDWRRFLKTTSSRLSTHSRMSSKWIAEFFPMN